MLLAFHSHRNSFEPLRSTWRSKHFWIIKAWKISFWETVNNQAVLLSVRQNHRRHKGNNILMYEGIEVCAVCKINDNCAKVVQNTTSSTWILLFVLLSISPCVQGQLFAWNHAAHLVPFKQLVHISKVCRWISHFFSPKMRKVWEKSPCSQQLDEGSCYQLGC